MSYLQNLDQKIDDKNLDEIIQGNDQDLAAYAQAEKKELLARSEVLEYTDLKNRGYNDRQPTALFNADGSPTKYEDMLRFSQSTGVTYFTGFFNNGGFSSDNAKDLAFGPVDQISDQPINRSPPGNFGFRCWALVLRDLDQVVTR